MSVPEQVGRYRIRRRLGSGAFATVWLADDEELETPVAIKVLADNWTHQLDVRNRFTEEARILRRAESERLVRVLDVGELPDGRPYLVMTYASGGTLAERLESGPMPVQQALRIAADLARAVAVLHELGTLHRDLKPSNVFFTGEGAEERVLVGDLGLAKALAHGSGFTVVAGSPGYMAPEQAQPGGGLDERADVYALGALAYHLLTGRPPTAPVSVQAVAAAAAEPLARPSRVRPEVPPHVDGVVLRALHVMPARRWPSATAFASALAAAAAGPPARRPVPAGRLTALSALAVVAVLVGTASGAGPPPQPQWTRVSDASEALSVAVPSTWAKEVRRFGWNPRSVLLPAERAPGLVVASELSTWSDATSAVPGVFMGAARSLRKSAPALPDHSGCRLQADRRIVIPAGGTLVRRWTRCGDTGLSFSEVLLTPNAGDYGVYLQIRQVGGADHTEEILRGIQLGAALAPGAQDRVQVSPPSFR
ncbi:serine/threonine-protein kinase [Micromonospora sp. NPDC000089]|uniref:serine/threonine-protein kinase n=1 Tax=unclassified Micromonospora TaxID=2617518 RepID=UPI0036959746